MFEDTNFIFQILKHNLTHCALFECCVFLVTLSFCSFVVCECPLLKQDFSPFVTQHTEVTCSTSHGMQTPISRTSNFTNGCCATYQKLARTSTTLIRLSLIAVSHNLASLPFVFHTPIVRQRSIALPAPDRSKGLTWKSAADREGMIKYLRDPPSFKIFIIDEPHAATQETHEHPSATHVATLFPYLTGTVSIPA